MSQPLATGPLVLYMTASENNGERWLYSDNMSILQILGAIYSYYQQPISPAEVKASPHADKKYRRDVLRRLARGEVIRRIEWMGDHTNFAGFQPYNEGYQIAIE